MKTRELLVIGFGFLIVAGLSLSFNYFQHTIQPLNSSSDHLDEIVSSSDPVLIHTNLYELKYRLAEVMRNLPENKNPVWFFPTESTNFLRIQNDVDVMITGVDKISTIPKDSSAYHTGMLDINSRSMVLKNNLLDAKGFMYVSPANLSFTLMWLIGIIGTAKLWMKNEN